MSQNIVDRSGLPILFHLKLVAKIALGVGAAACAGLLAVLFLLSEDRAASYAQIVIAHNLASRNLASALLVFGLAMVAFAGVLTWLISLYSSFRVAGPLYRFSQNLENEIKHLPGQPIAIRRTDELQREWQEFRDSVAVLRGHYAEIEAAVRQAEQLLREPAAPPGELRAAIERLKETDRRVRF